MKSIVVEIKDGFAAILSDNGCITKVVNNNYEIGQVIEMNQNKKILNVKKLVASAATAVILIAGAGFGTWAYASPYSYVSLDVNPSIEYTINRFDRVLSVKAVNDDGSEVLKNIQLKDLENQTIETALSKTVAEIAAQGYFEGEDKGGIYIATSSKDAVKSEELAKELEESVKAELEIASDEQGENTNVEDTDSEDTNNEDAGNDTNNEDTNNEDTDEKKSFGDGIIIEVEVISVSYDRVQEAAKLGVTPGKLNLVEKLQASSENPDSIVIEEWLNKPVKEIMKAIKENRKAGKSDEEDTDDIETIITVTPTEGLKENTNLTEETTAKDVENKKDAKEVDKKIAEKAKKTEEKETEKAKKAEEKATKKVKEAEEKETEKAKKAEEKAAKKAKEAEEKAVEKAKEAEEKAAEKAKEAEEKAAEKAKEAEEKATKKAKKFEEKEDDKAKEAEEKEADKVKEAEEKAAEKTKEATEKNAAQAKNQSSNKK